MPVKVKKFVTTAQVEANPIPGDETFEQRETTVDGYTFHWGPNQTRNFADDGVGIAHAAFGAAGVAQDIKPMSTSRS